MMFENYLNVHVYSQKYLRNLMFVVYLLAGILFDLWYYMSLRG